MCGVICSDQEGWKHVSVAPFDRKIVPGWELMCTLKEWFFDDEQWVVQYHPPRSDYVNVRPNCLHLWASLEVPFPVPPNSMV